MSEQKTSIRYVGYEVTYSEYDEDYNTFSGNYVKSFKTEENAKAFKESKDKELAKAVKKANTAESKKAKAKETLIKEIHSYVNYLEKRIYECRKGPSGIFHELSDLEVLRRKEALKTVKEHIEGFLKGTLTVNYQTSFLSDKSDYNIDKVNDE